MHFIEPGKDAVEAFCDAYPVDKPVVMLNLLRFKARAAYPDDSPAEPCSGFDAYRRYGAGVMPLIKAAGGELVWQGRQSAMLIGPQDKDWHLAALVRYPSAGAFLAMVSSALYQEVSSHRAAALEDSRLIAMEEF